MPGKVVKTSSASHEGDITALDYCSKTDLLYTAGGDGKVKVGLDFPSSNNRLKQNSNKLLTKNYATFSGVGQRMQFKE